MSNFFGVLDDSDDENPTPSQRPVDVAAASKTKKATTTAATTTTTRPVAEPKKTKAPVAESSTLAPRRDIDGLRSNNSNSTGRGEGRAGRVASREGKRAYDRRSGTGRGHEIKKGGGGARNWGSDQNEARNAQKQNNDGEEQPKVVDAENAGLEQGEAAAVDAENTNEELPVVEQLEEENQQEEDVTLTLDEYLKKKAEEQNEIEVFKALTVKELVIDEAFTAKPAFKKEQQDFLVMGEGKKPRKKTSTKSEKQTLQADFKVGAPSNFGPSSGGAPRSSAGRGGDREMSSRRDNADTRGSGEGGRRGGGGRSSGDRGGRYEGRGARGGGRGDRGGRGTGNFSGGRGDNNNNKPKIDVADTTAFPSL